MALELNAKVREVLGRKVKTLRKKGIIPAVIYGEKVKLMPLEVDYHEFEKVYKEVGESTIINLKIQNPKSKPQFKNVLIYDLSKDPVTDKFIHIDFYAVRMDKPITAKVPLTFEGKSPAVETEEGVLVKNVTEVEVEALPANLPHEIKVDISALKTFDDLIKIKDLQVSEDVKIIADPEEVVALVEPPRSEEELAELEEKPEEAEGPEVAEEIEEEEVSEEGAKEEGKKE